jgi:hypothetical protein
MRHRLLSPNRRPSDRLETFGATNEAGWRLTDGWNRRREEYTLARPGKPGCQVLHTRKLLDAQDRSCRGSCRVRCRRGSMRHVSLPGVWPPTPSGQRVG